jgi:hypothetical protein
MQIERKKGPEALPAFVHEGGACEQPAQRLHGTKETRARGQTGRGIGWCGPVENQHGVSPARRQRRRLFGAQVIMKVM